MVNTLAVRVQIGEDDEFEDVLHRTSETFREGEEHQEFSYETLMEQSLSSPHPLPALNVFVSVVNEPDFGGTFAGIPGLFRNARLEYNHSAKFELSFYFFADAEKLALSVEYGKNLFKASTIKKIMSLLVALMEEATLGEGPVLQMIPQSAELASLAATTPPAYTRMDPARSDDPVPVREGDVSAMLAGLWEDVLGRRPDKMGAHFFEEGGNSIGLLRLLSLVNEKLGLSLLISDFAGAFTLAGQSMVLQKQLGGKEHG
jgi:non-ribosomal peptide synthetase component F